MKQKEHVNCNRCHYKWIKRVTTPERCPKCNSPYWNKPRKRPVKAKR